MTDPAAAERDREIEDVIARMEAECAAFIAAATERSREWTRERIERYVAANYARTLALEPKQLAALREATDTLVDEEVPARIESMLAKRDDIWMHRRPLPGRRGFIEYDGGQRLPDRIRNAIAAALGRADRLLDEYGYVLPGMTGPPGFDPTPRMRRSLLAYAELQPELATLLVQDHTARRVQRDTAATERDGARDDAGREEALRRWQEAAKPAKGT